MTRPVAKQGDRVVGVDTHMVIPECGGMAKPESLPFDGTLDEDLSSTVLVEGHAIALAGSRAHQAPGHVVEPKSFERPPSNQATVVSGSSTVLANGRPVARGADPALTCNDPGDLPVGTVVAAGTVLAGG